MVFRQQKIAFSADQLIIQKQKLDFSITKPRRFQFEAALESRAAVQGCSKGQTAGGAGSTVVGIISHPWLR